MFAKDSPFYFEYMNDTYEFSDPFKSMVISILLNIEIPQQFYTLLSCLKAKSSDVLDEINLLQFTY